MHKIYKFPKILQKLIKFKMKKIQKKVVNKTNKQIMRLCIIRKEFIILEIKVI